MRWVGGLIAVCLMALGACSDPVTNTVAISEILGANKADVAGSLPKIRAELLTTLADYGYMPRELPVCEDDRSMKCAEFWAPTLNKSDAAQERLHFFKQIEDEDSGDTFGLIVDLGEDGRVLSTVGYRAFSWIF